MTSITIYRVRVGKQRLPNEKSKYYLEQVAIGYRKRRSSTKGIRGLTCTQVLVVASEDSDVDIIYHIRRLFFSFI